MIDFLDLLVIGDLNKAVSWAEEIDSNELNYFRRRAYLEFYLNRMVFHPIKFIKTLFNLIFGLAETKTENKIRTFIKRKTIKSKQYTPYSTERLANVLLKKSPIYAYSDTLYKTFKTVFSSKQ